MVLDDWRIINEALEFYSKQGYEYVDVPWLVPDEIARLTFNGDGLVCQEGSLIGSAEQGCLALDKDWGSGKFVSCSPCFRNEPHVSNIHRMWFMKVELFALGDRVDEFLNDALLYMNTHIPVESIKTNEGWDIDYKGLELGSYGYRKCDSRFWTFGTGVAVPRFSIAMRDHQN